MLFQRKNNDLLTDWLVQLGTTAPPEVALQVRAGRLTDRLADWLVQLGTTAPPEVPFLIQNQVLPRFPHQSQKSRRHR